MKTFFYEAYTGDGGKVEKGRIDADGYDGAARLLAKRGLTPFKISDQNPSLLTGGADRLLVRRARLSFSRFFQDLDTLLSSGFSIDAALSAVETGARGNAQKQTLSEALQQLRSGRSVPEAFSAISGLPEGIKPLLESGESSGRLDKVIAAIARDLARQEERRAAILGALVYPAFLLVTMFGALIAITFFLVPALTPIFESAAVDTPIILSVLGAINHALTDNATAVMAGLLVVAAAAAVVVRNPRLRAAVQQNVRRIPLLGPMLHKRALTRYLQTVALLAGNGVPIGKTLELAAKACPITAYQSRLQNVRLRVLEGGKFVDALGATGLVDGATLTLLALGEDANRLSEMLERAAFLLDRDTTQRMDHALKLMTPVVTILMGGLIGTLVISVMGAILSINDVAFQQ